MTIILGVLVIDNSCSCLKWGSVRDGGADSLTQSLTESFTHSLSKGNKVAGAVCFQFPFQTMMPIVRMAHPVLYSGCKGQRAVPWRFRPGWKKSKDFSAFFRLRMIVCTQKNKWCVVYFKLCFIYWYGAPWFHKKIIWIDSTLFQGFLLNILRI